MEDVHLSVSGICGRPNTFLGGCQPDYENLKHAVKFLYDHLRRNEVAANQKSVPELYIEGMDDEQVWQQLELQNNFTLETLVENSSKFLAMQYDSYQLSLADNTVEEESLSEGEEDDDPFEEEGSVPDEEEELEDDDDQDDSVEDEKAPNESGEPGLEDDFFKLNELNRFLDEEDRKEMNKSKKRAGDDDDGIDLFQDLDDDGGDDAAVDMKYADFFEKPQKTARDNRYDQSDDEVEQSEFPEDVPNSEEPSKELELSDMDEDEQISTHEDRQERLRKRIEKMEKKSIGDKPWQLKGEVKASSRPENALLEEYLEFDSATRPAPLITEETTKRLDDIILQRIKDRAYDDVTRKAKPVDASNEFRKKLVLDQTKSKESLAQIYEKDFLKKVESGKDNGTNHLEEESLIKKEIRDQMNQLMAKLDALSNYHFTPKPAAPDIKIITNTPAIDMEEATPVAVSNATLLAPEEVKRPIKGNEIGRTERDKTDKNRERRRKKLKQRLNASNESKSGTTTTDVTKARNVQRIKEVGTGKELKSSKEFFSKLQEEVKQKPESKTKKKRTSIEENGTAKRFKL